MLIQVTLKSCGEIIIPLLQGNIGCSLFCSSLHFRKQ